MGGEERVERQHASGRLTVRERIERLSTRVRFHETGALAGRGELRRGRELSEFLPANMVVGQGRIDGRRGVVQGDDFTVRGGAADAAIWEKAVYAERLAHDLRLPLVRLVDGTGGGGSVKTLEQMGFSYVPPLPGFELVVENLSIVPVVGRGARPGARASAPRAWSFSHFSVIVRGQRAAVRRRAAGRARPAWARRPTRRSSAGARCRRAPARWTTTPPTRTTRSRSSGASSRTCPTTSGSRRRCGTRAIRRTGARRSSLSMVPRDPASPTRCAACSTRCWTATRSSSWEPRSGARDHRAGAPRRPARRRARLRPEALRRRGHGGRRRRSSPGSWTCATSSTCRS